MIWAEIEQLLTYIIIGWILMLLLVFIMEWVVLFVI